MTPKFRREWRTIDPENPRSITRRYGNHAEARDDTDRFPHRIVQHRLVSDWRADDLDTFG